MAKSSFHRYQGLIFFIQVFDTLVSGSVSLISDSGGEWSEAWNGRQTLSSAPSLPFVLSRKLIRIGVLTTHHHLFQRLIWICNRPPALSTHFGTKVVAVAWTGSIGPPTFRNSCFWGLATCFVFVFVFVLSHTTLPSPLIAVGNQPPRKWLQHCSGCQTLVGVPN